MKYKFSLVLTAFCNDEGLQDTLNSVKHLVDHYVFYDTSNDGSCTPTVQQWALDNNKPGQVICPISEPSVHLKDNLNYLWTYVRLNLQHDVEFIVYLEPGETFVMNTEIPKSYPSILDCLRLYLECKSSPKSLFSFVTVCGATQCTRWNIVRNNQLYTWQGNDVDIYLAAEHDSDTHHVDWFFVSAYGIDCNDTESIDLESMDLNEPRTVFFLAQTYEGRQDVPKAVELYRKRTQQQGDLHERYVAFLRLGRLLQDYNEKVSVFMEGYKLLPDRLECLYEWMMTEHSNIHNKDNHVRTVRVGKMAPCFPNQLRHYNEKHFMVEPAIYEWRFDFDLAISCYYAQEYKLGIEANERAKLKAPQHILRQIEANLKFFPKPDPVADRINALMLDETTLVAVPTTVEDSFGLAGSFYARSNQLFVIDNFYADPKGVRDLALNAKYSAYGCGACGADNGINLLGFVSTSSDLQGTMYKTHSDCALKVSDAVQKLIARPLALKDIWLNGKFQYGTQDSTDYVHRDKADWVVMVMMCPVDLRTYPQLKFMVHKDLNTDVVVDEVSEAVMEQDSFRLSSWHCVDLLTLYNNRCVIYNGRRSHIVTKLFGSSKEDSFVFQKFYFDEC